MLNLENNILHNNNLYILVMIMIFIGDVNGKTQMYKM